MSTLVKDDGACFVCGKDNPVGLKISFTIDPDQRRAEAHTIISENFQGWQNITHGGIIAALLDEVCMHACRTIGDQLVTAEITVRYRKPVPTGQRVRLVGEVYGEDRRVILARGYLELEGQKVAEAEARVFRLRENR